MKKNNIILKVHSSFNSKKLFLLNWKINFNERVFAMIFSYMDRYTENIEYFDFEPPPAMAGGGRGSFTELR